jgi:F-type H+-transporting ATPase subunit gamma
VSGKLKEVRVRISSINSTKQITSAMKMVSASKLKKAQGAVVKLRPYTSRLNQMLENVSSGLEGEIKTVFDKPRKVKNVLLVVITSNRGLCGAFNANIIKKAEAAIQNEMSEYLLNGSLTVMCVGKKALDYFRHHYPDVKIIDDHVSAFEDLKQEATAAISNELMQYFEANEYDLINVFYSRFKNASIQYPEIVQFLPILLSTEQNKDENDINADYIFEPEKDKLMIEIVKSTIHNNFHSYLLETHASEHGARMTAMENATKNANELLQDMKLEFNKARQESITKELLEIITGASALES